MDRLDYGIEEVIRGQAMKRFLTLAASLATGIFAQVYNAADGRTPLVLEPGSPGGVYQLSDLETVNLMNGQVSVAIPLLRVGGRGEVGYTISTPITRTPWTVDISTNTDACALSESNCTKYGFSAGAQPQWANPFYQAGYGPGLFVYKRAGGIDRSYGIQVARLAGLPKSVIQTAQRLLAQAPEAPPRPPMLSQPALPMFEAEPDSLRAELEALDLNRMTPLEALNWIAQKRT